MSSLQFARIIDPVCSCGEYVGRFQPDIEFAIVAKGNYGKNYTDDIDVAEILNELGITRMCCRRTIIMSPVLRLIRTHPLFTDHTGDQPFELDFDKIIIRNENPDVRYED